MFDRDHNFHLNFQTFKLPSISLLYSCKLLSIYSCWEERFPLCESEKLCSTFLILIILAKIVVSFSKKKYIYDVNIFLFEYSFSISRKWILLLEYLSKNNSTKRDRLRILHDSQEPADPMFYFQVILQALGRTHLIWKLDDIDDPLRRKPVKSFAYAPPLILLEFSPLLKIVFDAGSCPFIQKNYYFLLVRCKKDRDTNFFFLDYLRGIRQMELFFFYLISFNFS